MTSIELVSPAWLATELAHGFGFERNHVVLEVGCGPPDRTEHIPHSSWLDTNDIETDDRCWRLVEEATLIHRLGRGGISRFSTVIISGAPLVSARVAWALAHAGVRRVKIVDGGFSRWIAERRPTTRGWSRPRPQWFGSAAPLDASVRATRENVRAILSSSDTVLADVRSRAEHEGLTSGYSYIRRKGRIRGSVFACGGPSPSYLERYTRDDGCFAEPDRIEAMWCELGIIRDGARICFYCGTGWRACVAFLFARWLGLAATVYDGGWFDWTELGRSCSNARSECAIQR